MYNYSKLLGRIKECGYTQERLAKEINKSEYTISAKINNRGFFSQAEIQSGTTGMSQHIVGALHGNGFTGSQFFPWHTGVFQFLALIAEIKSCQRYFMVGKVA